MAALGDGDLVDPHPDIVALFCYYNALYFDSNLGACSVQWSSPRMTLCAGICKYSFAGGCEIRLSEPLLKYRGVSDLKNTLLHEMIHAYLFLTSGNKDHDDHGRYFLAKMKDINESRLPDFERPSEGYRISVYHNFRDEVDNYRVHHWKCGTCGIMIKRAMNRAPSAADCTVRARTFQACSHPRCQWHSHQKSCGGSYVKVAEPPGYKDRQKKTKKNAADCGTGAAASSSSKIEGSGLKNSTLEMFFPGKGRKLIELVDLTSEAYTDCPICKRRFQGDMSVPEINREVNEHLDSCLSTVV